ncbi:macrophage mannose receptor 1 isoform X3 [Fundulus heteroclitus]|uniref:macrophage mannose receptor 1 isoform X3 n=1 Tax=Fundulus heteroclitus TaxID=8078 RepID=UPI00165BC41A|nr:macrophage mannose receptor 1 isoform X3 [Fundulus heteroclitus]
MRILCLIFVLLCKKLHSVESNDSEFQLTSKASGFCLVKSGTTCDNIRWTTGKRLLVPRVNKCLGAQGKSVGSEVILYDCDEASELQRWECKNETVLALQGQELYVELKADNTAVLSKSVGPNTQLTISGTPSGACTRTYRELYTIEGNAAGRPCMFPFMYKNQWYSSCTDSEKGRLWCSVETKYDNKTWGYCPTNAKENWNKHPTNGAAYQLNTQSALTWSQAETSCKQQSASLLSITDPDQQAYITAILEAGGSTQEYKLWTGLTLNSERGWEWSNGNPFRYLNWDSGHPFTDPGHSCGIIDGVVRFSWQSSKCDYKLGYICYSKGILASPTEGLGVGFCSPSWIPYNGHCFSLFRTAKTWSDAQLACSQAGGNLASIRNTEDQSFVISQLGYAATDELWIGLNDRQREGLFDWSDHSTVSFTSWEFGRPAVATDQEDCVLIRGESGNWVDRDCQEKHGFICVKRSNPEPSGDEVEQNPGCKPGWKRHGSFCYYTGTERKTFDEAKDHCKTTESYLADVSTRVDNAFLVSLVGLRPEKHFWLGLSNRKNRDVFEWTYPVPVKYTHWNSEMPGNNQGCVAMATGISAGLWDVLPCTNREKYICKHLAEGAVLPPAPPTVPSVQCPESWFRVPLKHICYKVFSGMSNKRTWFEARDYCTAVGGDLLSIHSAAELRLERRYPNHEGVLYSYGSAWIGLSVPDSSTGYKWSDGSPVNFQHWRDGEPNNKNNAESCVEMFIHDWDKAGSWNDNHCEKYNSWICQIPTGATPNSPPPPATPDYNRTSDGWLEWKGKQYYLNNRLMAMEDARRFCKEKHSDLVTFSSEDENVFLWKQIYSESQKYWIGLTVDLDKTAQWIDGSPVIFQWWADHQPEFKKYDETCVAMMPHNGLWHDYNCGFELKSICKRSGTPPANATVAPTVPPKGGCEDTWKKFNFKCYKLIQDQMLTWDAARQRCIDMGGNLASISSRHVQVFLVSQMVDKPTTDLWIGFHSAYRNGFYWVDGQPKSYINLNSQEQSSVPPVPYFGEDRYPMRLRHRLQTSWRHSHDLSWRPSYGSSYTGKCAVINTDPSLGIGKWRAKSCNDSNGFICLKAVDPQFQDSPEPKPSTNYIKIINDSINVFAQQMPWDEAKKNCEADGGSLASIRTEWAQVYIEQLALNLNRSLWIGLNKAQTNNYFRYIGGWHVKFTHWGENEPRRGGTCVFVDVDGKWKTGDCNKNLSSVCMKSTDTPPKADVHDFPGVCPEDPDPVVPWRHYSWKPFRGFCYIFFSEVKEWPEAATSCVAHGGSLASIADPFEQEFIKNNIATFRDRQSSYWIGLFKTHKGEWMWLDRTVMDYSYWDQGQPGFNTYGLISALDGRWRTSYQTADRPYICKTAKVLLPTPLSLPDVALESQDRSRVPLIVLLIVGIAVGAGIVFVLLKKSGHIPAPARLSAFDNPLFSNKSSDLVDSKNLVENAD